MRITGFQLGSLFIDRMSQRWLARGLFLFVLCVSVASTLWPLGNRDLSQFYDWLNEYSSMNPSVTAAQMTLPTITWGNILYVLFNLFIVCVYLFVSFFYAHVYIGDKAGQKTKQSVGSFISRTPVLIAFYVLFIVPMLVMSMFFWISYLFFIPALFISPTLLLYDKMNIFHSVMNSFRYSNGYKLSIFWNLLTLYMIFMLLERIPYFFIPLESNAGVLLNGFIIAFIVLALGRLLGIFHVMLHPSADINTQKS
jgi:hypothetical protein